MLRSWIALLIVALPLAAAPVPKAAKKPDDTKAILGRWQGSVGGHGNGSEYTFRFADDGTCGIGSGPNAPEKVSDCLYTLDPAGSPKRMKWLNGPARTEWQCVYELDGDTLKVGFVPHGKPIPDSLELKDGLTVYELKRLKDDK